MKHVFKIIFLLALTSLCSFVNKSRLYAQVVTQGSVHFFAGYGYPNYPALVLGTVSTGISLAGLNQNSDAVQGSGPYTFGLLFGVAKKLDVGIQMGYVGATSTLLEWEMPDPSTGTLKKYSYRMGLSIITAMAKIDYHYLKSNRADVYTGVAAGYGSLKVNTTGDADPNMPKIQVGGFIYSMTALGLRYMFAGNLGAFTELGYGAMGYVTAGISAKFGGKTAGGWQNYRGGNGAWLRTRHVYNDDFN